MSLSLLQLPTLDFASLLLRIRPDSTHLTRELVENMKPSGLQNLSSPFSLWTQILGYPPINCFRDSKYSGSIGLEVFLRIPFLPEPFLERFPLDFIRSSSGLPFYV